MAEKKPQFRIQGARPGFGGQPQSGGIKRSVNQVLGKNLNAALNLQEAAKRKVLTPAQARSVAENFKALRQSQDTIGRISPKALKMVGKTKFTGGSFQATFKPSDIRKAGVSPGANAKAFVSATRSAFKSKASAKLKRLMKLAAQASKAVAKNPAVKAMFKAGFKGVIQVPKEFQDIARPGGLEARKQAS